MIIREAKLDDAEQIAEPVGRARVGGQAAEELRIALRPRCERTQPPQEHADTNGRHPAARHAVQDRNGHMRTPFPDLEMR